MTYSGGLTVFIQTPPRGIWFIQKESQGHQGHTSLYKRVPDKNDQLNKTRPDGKSALSDMGKQSRK